MEILIFGHKNPDTDSVASSMALSTLKNYLSPNSTAPCTLGKINKETQFVLNYFQVEPPRLLKDVKTQVSDLAPSGAQGISPDCSILYAYRKMSSENLETLAVVDATQKLLGIISMKDIAMGLIKGDYYELNTSFTNLVNGLEGTVVTGSENQPIQGQLSIIAYYYKSIEGTLKNNDIVIVGDRYDIIEHAIEAQVKLIIVTGNKRIPGKFLEAARAAQVSILSVPYDTYYTSKMISQCNAVSTIMRTQNILYFHPDDYLDEAKEAMGNSHFRNYPVVKEDHTFVGFINRKHMMNSGKKQVILVDHNEYGQSVEGLREAEILEIIDHHKLGDISTSIPIHFRNTPVGSTCTIVFQMFQEQGVQIDLSTGGLLLSGIISDTLALKSPTTTPLDVAAVKTLNGMLGLDLEQFTMELFKAGTSLEGQAIHEVFHKDYKEFSLAGFQVGISQVFTLDIDSIFNRKIEFTDYLTEIHQNSKQGLTMLLITDILKEGSYLLFNTSSPAVISYAFQVKPEQGVFLEGIVSRKKQVVPQILHGISLL